MKVLLESCVIVLLIGMLSCNNKGNVPSQEAEATSTPNQIKEEMKSYLSIFEIPATEFSRAVAFYQAILDIEIAEIDMQGTQMGLFPSEGQSVAGVIVKGEGYEPVLNGVVIYLNGGDDLQKILTKVENNGGKILVPKTLIDEENGHFAHFLDTEGNRIDLHSLH